MGGFLGISESLDLSSRIAFSSFYTRSVERTCFSSNIGRLILYRYDKPALTEALFLRSDTAKKLLEGWKLFCII